jgi:thiol-disulfide isomerase/thioredoxin
MGLNSPDRQLDSYRGRRLIINVWASWCGPCRAEAASLERFAWTDFGSKYSVIGISTDDYRSAAESWLRHSNATLSHFIDRALAMEKMLGADRIPLTVLVDEQGRVVARVQGAREWDNAEQRNFIERAYRDFGSARPR